MEFADNVLGYLQERLQPTHPLRGLMSKEYEEWVQQMKDAGAWNE